MEIKPSLTKESWAELTIEEKNKELQKIIPGADYQTYLNDYNRLKEIGKHDYFCFEHPVLVLSLIDPVMATELTSWLYTQGDKLNQIPVFGYKLEEVTLRIIQEKTGSPKE